MLLPVGLLWDLQLSAHETLTAWGKPQPGAEDQSQAPVPLGIDKSITS